jgi:hypothetical protein
MKKFIMASLVFALMASTAQAGFLTNMVAGDGEGTVPSIMYKLEAFGNDVRVYEWTPRDNKNVRCVFAAGSQNATGVACYEVETKK